MTSSILRTLFTLSLSAALSPVALLAQSQMYVTVPFNFTVGAQSFAPGEYRVQPVNPGLLEISDLSHRAAVYANVMPADRSKQFGTILFTFKRYGEKLFLSEIAGDSRGWLLKPAASENEMIARKERPTKVVVTSVRSSN
ncbi:MAG: hypothetical protein ABSB35_04270 [Bryobacteraceae bacterium]|jgi:hypothetical protein